MPLGGLGIALTAAILPAAWCPRVVIPLAVLTGALALLVTLNRPQEFLPVGWWPWEVWRLASVGSIWPGALREQLNVLLLLPLTYFSTLALRRPAIVAAAGALLSFGIEYAQAATGLGTAQLADLLHNAAGAGLGAAAAALLLSAVDRTFRYRSSTDSDEAP